MGRRIRFEQPSESETAAGTQLTYSINPNQAFVGLSTTLTVTMTNNTSSDILLQSGRSGAQILITFPTGSDENALTPTVNFNGTMLTPGYQVGLQGAGGNTFQVYPTSNQKLPPKASIQVQFGPISVNSALGSASLPIQEFIGGSSGSSSVAVQKIPQQLAVIAWLIPWDVGLNQPATLNWQSFGATNVQVSGFPSGGPQNFPVSGSPPFQSSTTVTLLPSDPQRTYTLVANSGDGRQSNPVSATLTQQPPQISSLVTIPAVPPNPFDPSLSAKIDWTTAYASAVFLSYPQGARTVRVPANPAAPQDVNPGLDALRSAISPVQIPATATYVLQATGYTSSASGSVSFNLGPMAVLYFKYLNNQDGVFSGVSFQLAGSWPGAAQLNTLSSTLSQLVVNQPGGQTTTMYLGSGDTTNSPQIQYFNAASASGGFTLSWVTANLTSLVLDLNPGSYQVPQDQIASGTYTVNPSATTTYVLTGTGPNGTVTSTLDVVVTSLILRRRRKSPKSRSSRK